ncbi:MAG: hypothetical protein ACXV3U_01875 [Halobacteriota archaeon]
MNSIEAVSITTILDANGCDAVETEVVTTDGYGRCSFPAPRHATKSARKEVGTLIGRDANQQADVDEILQGVFALPNMSMVFSVAVANAAAASLEMPLYRYLGGLFANAMPYPLLNILDATADYLIAPIGASSFSAGIASSVSIYREFSKLNVPRGASDVDVLSRLNSIAQGASDNFGFDIKLGVDFTSVHDTSRYYTEDRGHRINRAWLSHVIELIDRYDLCYVQVPFVETDQSYLAQLREALHTRCLIACGLPDNNIVAGGEERDIHNKTDVSLLTPTRTISNVFRRCTYAKAHNLSCVMLTHTATTCEVSPSHLAVALSVPFVKLSLKGSENTSKINELLRIEQELYEGSNPRMVKKPNYEVN